MLRPGGFWRCLSHYFLPLYICVCVCVCLKFLQWVVSGATVRLSCHSPKEFSSLPPGERAFPSELPVPIVCSEPFSCSAARTPASARLHQSRRLLTCTHLNHGLISVTTSRDHFHLDCSYIPVIQLPSFIVNVRPQNIDRLWFHWTECYNNNFILMKCLLLFSHTVRMNWAWGLITVHFESFSKYFPSSNDRKQYFIFFYPLLITRLGYICLDTIYILLLSSCVM